MVEAVARLTVDVVPVFSVAGANVAVKPVGRPEAVKVVETAEPEETVGLATVVVLAPALTLALAAERPSDKLPGAATVTVKVAVWLTPFDAPFTTTA